MWGYLVAAQSEQGAVRGWAGDTFCLFGLPSHHRVDFSVAVITDSFGDSRTGVFRLLWLTKDQWLFRNPSVFWCQIGTAETPSPLDRATARVLASLA